MTVLILVSAWLLFAAFAAAVRFHFRRDDHVALKMKMISLVSIVYLCGFTSLLLTSGTTISLAMLAFGLMLASGWLFIWTILFTLQNRLPLAFDPAPSRVLLSDGPYQYLRHPFYTSYMLCWLGCFAATPSIILLPPISILAGLYWIAMQREERSLLNSFGEQYLTYRRASGWRNLLQLLRS